MLSELLGCRSGVESLRASASCIKPACATSSALPHTITPELTILHRCVDVMKDVV